MSVMIWALVGGVLIGTASAILLLTEGRVAGVTGIAGAVFDPSTSAGRRQRSLIFLGGLVVGGLLYAQIDPSAFDSAAGRSNLTLIIAGLLVGYGTRLGSGCTNGHGVCGIGRRSPRSVVATLVFLAVGMLSATLYSLGSKGAF